MTNALLTYKNHQQRGFSLLEIMIVILIIGIGASAVRLAVSKSDPLEGVLQTSGTFQFWFNKKIDETLLSNHEVGIYFMKTSVAVLTWRDGNKDDGEAAVVWEVEDEFDYSSYEPFHIELTLNLESAQWLELENALPEDLTGLEPHVILMPSEDYFPSFKLEFSTENDATEFVSIVGDGYNRLELVRETR